MRQCPGNSFPQSARGSGHDRDFSVQHHQSHPSHEHLAGSKQWQLTPPPRASRRRHDFQAAFASVTVAYFDYGSNSPRAAASVTPKNRYTLFVFASAAAAALGAILTEIALRFSVTSLSIAFFSNLSALGLLLIPVLSDGSRPWRRWPAADWFRLFAGGMAIFCVGFVLYYLAIDHIGAAKTVMLGRLEAIFVVILAVLFLGEKWSARHWFGTFLAVGGTSLVNFDPAIWELQLGTGEALTLLAATSFAAGIVALKPLLDRRDPRFVTAGGFLIGSVFMLPFVLGVAPLVATVTATPVRTIVWPVLFVIIIRGFLLGISWLTYNAAMPHIGASRCSILFLSSVFMTFVLQITVDAIAPGLGLQVPASLLTATTGAIIIVIGIILINR